MNILIAQKNNLDEVVFENRNKLYGAYALRRSYDANLNRAMLATLALLVFLFLAGAGSSWLTPAHVPKVLHHDIPIEPEQLSIIIELPPPPAIPVMREAGSTAPSTNAPPHIVRITQVTEVQPRIPVASVPAGLPALTGMMPPHNGRTDSLTAFVPVVAPHVIHDFVSDMPRYPGGAGEMMEFLQREIRYPQQAYELQREGVVLIAFVVEPDGRITDVKVEKPLGAGCDEEAVRVVEMMPRWEAGRQNGKSVPVKLRLPIRFRMQ